MDIQKNSRWAVLEFVMPWVVLALLLTYSYSKFFIHSYGFRWGSNGIVEYLFVHPQPPTLLVGDQLIKVGSVPWLDFHNDLRQTFFNGAKQGDVIPIVVGRDGQTLTIPWRYPGFNLGDFYDQLPSEWILAYIFWLAGLLTFQLVRPRDTRWRLLWVFDFLTAIWLIAGSGNSIFHSFNSALVLRMAVWLCVPVYLHLHWIFPRPLGQLPRLLVRTTYAIFTLIAVAQAYQLLPQSFYYLGFLIAVLGSVILLIFHLVRQPESRRDLRLLTIMGLLALAPSLAIAVAGSLDPSYSDTLSLGLLGLPLIPAAYLYAAYRRQLGDLEVRVNRFITIYLFLVLLGMFFLPIIAWAAIQFSTSTWTFFVAVTFSSITVLITLLCFPIFQAFIDQRLLGIRIPSKTLQQHYATHIATSVSLPELVRFIHEDLLPSLLVREFAFLQIEADSLKVLFSLPQTQEWSITEADITQLMGLAGKYRPANIMRSFDPFPWARLVLPLKAGGKLVGFWMFGRRDPEDDYPQVEIAYLQSLADQAAVALSNLLQTERIKEIYRANINRYEEERLALAHDLHDSILNQMAALMMKVDDSNLPPEFQESYDRLIQRLREIVVDLRPPMLTYGLVAAIEDLADNLMERSTDTITVVINIEPDQERFSQEVEQNLYRIVQEACENAIRHGHARNINISGQLVPQEINLRIEDDGIGFEPAERLELETLLANKHFGLAGMLERIKLIGGNIIVDSHLKKGVRIKIDWSSTQSYPT